MATAKAIPLEAYRFDVYGNKRNDFDMCVSALNAQSDKIAMVHSSIFGMESKTTDDYAAQVLTAAYDTLGDIIEITNVVITTLADCEVA